MPKRNSRRALEPQTKAGTHGCLPDLGRGDLETVLLFVVVVEKKGASLRSCWAAFPGGLLGHLTLGRPCWKHGGVNGKRRFLLGGDIAIKPHSKLLHLRFLFCSSHLHKPHAPFPTSPHTTLPIPTIPPLSGDLEVDMF